MGAAEQQSQEPQPLLEKPFEIEERRVCSVDCSTDDASTLLAQPTSAATLRSTNADFQPALTCSSKVSIQGWPRRRIPTTATIARLVRQLLRRHRGHTRRQRAGPHTTTVVDARNDDASVSITTILLSALAFSGCTTTSGVSALWSGGLIPAATHIRAYCLAIWWKQPLTRSNEVQRIVPISAPLRK